MKTPMRRTFASAALLTLGFPVLLLAQTPPAPATAAPIPPPSDEMVVLNPFTVSTDRDNGYTAVDSLAGGRQNAPIRVTPAAMSSLTRAFIDDLAITNVQEALRWTLNTVPTNFRNGILGASGGDVFNFWSVSIRGDSHVQGGNPPTKNYFPTFMAIDTYNVDRIEIDSGPNSILFGIGDIGGALTTYTKQAQFQRSFTNLVAQTSNYGGYRFTADVNQSLNRYLALRLNAVAANEKGWRKGDNHKKKGIDLAGTIRLGDKTHIRFEAEGWKEEKTVFAQSIQDGTSLWDGTTASNTWGSTIPNAGANPLNTPGAPGVATMNAWGGPANYYVWTPSVGLMNWAGGARSMGTGDVAWGAYVRPSSFQFGPTGSTVQGLPSRDFAVTPADGLLKPEALTLTLNFDQRINDNCEFEISGYRYTDDAKARNFEGAGGGLGFGVSTDLNKQLPNGQPNPNFGKRYSDYFLDAQTQDHWVHEVRGQFSYHFDTVVFHVPWKQLFSVSAGEQVTEYDARQYQATVMDKYDPNNWTQSMIWGRVYWDQPQAALSVPDTFDGHPIRYIALPFNWYDFNSKQTIKYGGAFSQTRLWDDRLNISLGIRRDKYDNWKVGLRGPSNPPTLSNGAGNTYTVGGVGYITKWLGIVANVSENYQPAAGGLAPSLYGETFGPSFGKGKNVGLRLSTVDGRYYSSLNYYEDTAHDVIGGDSPDYQGIWNDYFAAGGTVTAIGPAGTVTGGPGTYHANMSYTDTYDVKYTGWEFETTASPTENFRFQIHYSVPKGEKENNGPNAVRYFHDNLATWQAAAGGSTPESTKLASDLALAQQRITSAATPTTTGKLVKYIFNVFATYTFTNDTLKGIQIGAGASSLGRQYGQPWDTVNGVRTLSPGYTTYSALLGYTRIFDLGSHRVHARFQLNVDNLFNADKLIFLNYAAYGTNGIEGMDYNFIAPRRTTFTATFEF